jgi:hypothetical protein
MKKVVHELIVIARTALYFAIVFIFIMVMKKLFLKDYDIEFAGVSQALIGALIMSKVILLLELVKPTPWVRKQPAIVYVMIRTFSYTLGVLVVVLLEKVFESRHKADGFGNIVSYVFTHRDIYQVWANTLSVSASIFFYNAFSVVQRLLGKNGLAKLYFSVPLETINQIDFLPNKSPHT